MGAYENAGLEKVVIGEESMEKYWPRYWGALLLVAMVSGSGLGGPVPARASDDMKFEIKPPGLTSKAFEKGSTVIYASGDIRSNTRELFLDFIEKNNYPSNVLIYFNSSGGDAVGGASLGLAIRKLGYSTAVGSTKGEFKVVNGMRIYRDEAECSSACVFSFIGGVFRYFDPKAGNKVGVHQFRSVAEVSAAEKEGLAQGATAEIAIYYQEMGIDLKLLSIASSFPPNDLHYLTVEEIKETRLVNNGFEEPIWEFISGENSVKLQAMRETRFGRQIFWFVCLPDGIKTYAAMYVEENETEMTLQSDQFLKLNEENFSLKPFIVSKSKIANGVIAFVFRLPQEVLRKVSEAKHLGIIRRIIAGSELLFGIQDFPITGSAREKLKAHFASCSKDKLKAVKTK